MQIIAIAAIALIIIAIAMIVARQSSHGYTIVLLQKHDEKPTLSSLKAAVRAAWGEEPTDDPATPVAIRAVKSNDEANQGSQFMVKYHDMGFGLSYFPNTWFDQLKEKDRPEMEPGLLKVADASKAYWEIYLIRPTGKPTPESEIATAKLIGQLVNENTLGIMSQDYQTFNPMTDQVKETLIGTEPAKVFTTQLYIPMQQVSSEKLVEFQQQAKETFGQFVTAFNNKTPDDSMFSIKFKLEDNHGVEHVWATVKSIESDTITCEVANEPRIATTYKYGQAVNIKTTDLEDWMYKHKDQLKGGYSVPRK